MSQIDDKHGALLSSGVLDLGSPVGPEDELYDGGFVRPYEFGRIYFHPRVGEAFELHGLILATYLEQGAELSGLGYPITDELESPAVLGGRMNGFEQGSLVFDPASGVDVRLADTILVPQVIVKIQDGIFVPLGPGGRLNFDRFVADIAGPGSEFVAELVRSLLPGIAFRRLFDSATGDQIQFLLDEARANDPEFAPPDFNNFLTIDCPPGFDTDGLASALSQLQGVVEYAYTVPVASDPAVAGTPNAFFNLQGYLTAAPAGIGVQTAWAKGADGAGTQFIDLEQGWFLGHEDLPKTIRLIDGENRSGSFFHGAAVLGEVVGIDDSRGICGVAPLTSARVISYFRRKTPPTDPAHIRQTLADMLWRAQSELSFGDVLLIEAQFEGRISGVPTLVPVETDRVVWEVIRFATRRNVIVVEAAGNGDANLDEFLDHRGRRALNRFDAGFRDSGAIMVGSCTSTAPHGRILNPAPDSGGSSSNFGSRIDCHAWGENVVTCGSQAAPRKADAYFTGPFFGGTSSASPIIAGACLLVQNLFQTLNPATGGPGKLSAARMQRVLTAPSNTTSGAPGAAIGVMPDLKKLIAHEFI